MQIYDALKKDHETVRGLFTELLALDEQDDRHDELVEQIRDELIPHARAEEAVFYNALRALNADRSEIMHGYKEHLEAESLLRMLQVKDKVNADWKATARKLFDALEHHIQEEEGTIFSIARSMLSAEEADKIGAAFEKLKPEVRDQNAVQTSLEMVANLMPPRLSKTVLSETRPNA
jgi:hemerythrin superfamily protein